MIEFFLKDATSASPVAEELSTDGRVVASRRDGADPSLVRRPIAIPGGKPGAGSARIHSDADELASPEPMDDVSVTLDDAGTCVEVDVVSRDGAETVRGVWPCAATDMSSVEEIGTLERVELDSSGDAAGVETVPTGSAAASALPEAVATGVAQAVVAYEARLKSTESPESEAPGRAVARAGIDVGARVRLNCQSRFEGIVGTIAEYDDDCDAPSWDGEVLPYRLEIEDGGASIWVGRTHFDVAPLRSTGGTSLGTTSGKGKKSRW